MSFITNQFAFSSFPKPEKREKVNPRGIGKRVNRRNLGRNSVKFAYSRQHIKHPKKGEKRKTRKSLLRLLDKIVSQIVIARDKKCVVCGKRTDLTCGHLFSRSHYITRWDMTNCNCQCTGCNFKHEFDTYPYTRWFIDKYGLSVYDDLHDKHSLTKKWRNFELEELYQELVNSLPT